ncbi:MAG: hypothetical protein WCP14_02940 [bacterium]
MKMKKQKINIKIPRLGIFFGILTLTVILLITYSIFLYYPLKHESIDNISLTGDSNVYRLEKGIFLQGQNGTAIVIQPLTWWRLAKLANFYLAVKYEPIFIDSSLSENDYHDAVQSISENQDKIKNYYKLKEDFIPTEFMMNLYTLSGKYKKFIDTPSEKRAEEILDDYVKANQAYLQSAQKLKSVVIRAFPKSQSLNFINSMSTSAIIENNIDMIIINSRSLAKEIDDFRGVFSGLPQLSYYPKISQIADVIKEDNALLPLEDLGIAGGITTSGPYQVETGCFGGVNEPKLFYVRNLPDKNGDKTFIAPKYAENNYYYLLSLEVPAEAKLISQGYKYKLARETNTYKCNDLTYLIDILSLDEYRQNYSEKILGGIDISRPGFSKKDLEIINKAQKAEEVFYSDKIKRSASLKNLSNDYFLVYKALKNTDYPDKSLIINLFTRYSSVRGGTVGISRILNTKLYLEHLNESLSLVSDKKTVDERYINVARSAYSLTYFSYSPFVWKQPKPLLYQLNVKSPTNPSQTDYLTLIKKVGREEILSYHAITEDTVFEIQKQSVKN